MFTKVKKVELPLAFSVFFYTTTVLLQDFGLSIISLLEVHHLFILSQDRNKLQIMAQSHTCVSGTTWHKNCIRLSVWLQYNYFPFQKGNCSGSLADRYVFLQGLKMIQSNPYLCLGVPLLKQTEKTLVYTRQKYDNTASLLPPVLLQAEMFLERKTSWEC